MMMQIWQDSLELPTERFLIHFMIIVLLSCYGFFSPLCSLLQQHKKQPSSHCYHMNLCACCLLLFFPSLYLTHSSHNTNNNHNIEWKTKSERENDSTWWCDVKDALFLLFCWCRLWLFISLLEAPPKNEVKGQVGNRVNPMAPGVVLPFVCLCLFTQRISFRLITPLIVPCVIPTQFNKFT